MDEYERGIIISSLNSLRNKLIADDRYTDAVDDILVKIAFIIDPEEMSFTGCTVEVLSHPHEFSEWYAASLATCTENGEERRECEICGGRKSRWKDQFSRRGAYPSIPRGLGREIVIPNLYK